MHDNLDAWAIVITAGGTLIGELPHEGFRSHMDEGIVEMQHFYELNASVGLMPGGAAIQKSLIAMPFMGTELGAPIRVKPVGIQYLADMKPADKQRYKRLIEQAERQSEKTRASDVGIELARLKKE